MEFHELAAEYPLMPEVELNMLAGRLADVGFDRRFPIIRFQGKILDGRNRFRACEIAKVDPFYGSDFKGTEEEAKQFVEDANEHRRHLAPEWLAKRRQDRIRRVAEAHKNGQSTREIAEQEKVSQPQIRRDLQAAGETGVSGKPTDGKVTGKDGKEYAASKPKPAATSPAEQERQKAAERLSRQAAPSAPASDPPKDKDGKPYPQQAIAAVQFVSRLNELVRHLRDGCDLATQIAGEPIGLYLDPNGIVARLTDAKKLVLAAFPAHVCKNCKGKSKKCDWCKGNGWQTKGGFEQCPEPNA